MSEQITVAAYKKHLKSLTKNQLIHQLIRQTVLFQDFSAEVVELKNHSAALEIDSRILKKLEVDEEKLAELTKEVVAELDAEREEEQKKQEELIDQMAKEQK